MAKNESAAPPGYTTVSIYDQAYHLTGQNPAHIHRLAALVDSKMRAVAAQGRTVDSLRVAVLAALNLADELAQTAGADMREGHARALTLRGLLDEVLEEERKTGS
ncbi:MAG TPA: cell division protein ZapA [Terracidiphilus sp.]|jgi:cell division protein ZapA|nr:cell division protein ZapA [Terracidiphilus sp.]